MLLNKNDKIDLGGGDSIVVQKLLGEGGQGEVYLVTRNGQPFALKVYKDFESEDFRYNLKNNIDRGVPSEDFLWPKQLLDFTDGHIGYLMDLRPKNYVSFVSYLTGKTPFRSRAVLLHWCIRLCAAFKKLHESGYSYQDLNDGSFFLDPDTGDLLICDNDNVTADKKNLGILGKMRYMAPEIVRGEQLPDIHSDRFSLAVILFMALCLGNPYEGERLKQYDVIDEKAEYDLYGGNPVFTFHKTDRSNRPIRGYHTSVIRRWPYLPLYIKEAFHRTFVDGLADRENERTTELEWLRLLSAYRDELMTCPSCGYEMIYGFEEKQKTAVCPACGKPAPAVAWLSVGKHRVTLEPGKRLYAPLLDKFSSQYNQEIGEVIQNKKNLALWGIRLNTPQDTAVRDTAGTVKIIPQGGVIPIVQNLSIKFNENTKGEIQK